MSRVPDWVLDSKLETHFLPGAKHEIVHTYYEQQSLSQRPIKKFEHWQREKKIGGGGFGEVWLERCTKGTNHGNHVRATKQMEYERCFVKSFGWYQTEASLFIAMEYLELGDLQNYLHDQKQPLPEFEVQGIMFQILEGLDLMHDNGYAHRDLKPNNILLRSCPPNDWWVKIADFGISKRIEDSLGKPTTLRGTEGYIAPELYELSQRGTPYAVDIWAAGEIMFQLLTKQPTFQHVGLLFNNENLMSEPVQQKTATAARMMLPGTLKGHSSRVTCVAFSSDGKLVASGSDDLKVKLWNTTTGAIYRAFESHSQSVTCVAFSVDGKFVVAGSDDQTIIFWNIITGATHRTLKGSSYVRSVAFSPDGQLGASGYDGGTVELWNNITGTIYKTLKDPFSVPFLAFSPDNNTLEGHSRLVTSVAFSRDGKFVISGSDDHTIKFWNTITGAIDKTFYGHSSSVTCVASSPDGRLVASGSCDNTVKLWDAAI
ncbi:hypothetical protein PEX1_048850 [Penicillium expansum]|uniref:Protein kinase domain-containing protein n=1 Tax=Penicillium expansum TaxID=27334 RepID=A0A0A2JS60_PENEN|nr:hypothetical protein PEX2_067720 [Penicillium expansum]KGO46196.1 hypothetical protein PEXP_098080 [Penicillium expansum]KGO50877.1 hypothetical protein PEX1_048850 [Penicillium expansum]KGO58262.1 hypothetical protein PEX2_067720 [Penicillium expansum]